MKRNKFYIKICLIFAIIITAIFSGCKNPFYDITVQAKTDLVEYGSLAIGEPNNTDRSLILGEITSAVITVSGFGMDDITAETDLIDGGVNGVTINNIPTGKNRVITVEARKNVDGSPSKMDGVVMRVVIDINVGENTATVNWASTAKGNVFYSLLKTHSVNISDISESDITDLETFITTVQDSHALLVDAAAIAAKYNSEGIAGINAANSADFRIAPASITFTPSPAGSYSAQVGDPSSIVLSSIISEENTITGIVPGTWTFYLKSGENFVYQADLTFVSGETISQGEINLKVPSPVITPESEIFTDNLSVSLSCSMGDAEIYYTINGDDPTTASTLYSAPFEITDTTTIKATAFNSPLINSDIVTKTYTISEFAAPGITHPSTGAYSPLDINAEVAGFGWSTADWNLGVSQSGANANFAVYSKNATAVLLEIYSLKNGEDAQYDYWMEKGSDNIWRAAIAEIPENTLYAFRVWGPNWPLDSQWKRGNSSAGYISDVDEFGNRFNPNKVLFDPYAREISHDKSNPEVLGETQDGGMFASGGDDYNGVVRRNFDTGRYAPKSVFIVDSTSIGTKPEIAKKDAIIYEAHVRGLTNHSSTANLSTILGGIDGFEGVSNIPESYRGTYKGAALMAPYLKALGINTIELLPVHETDNDANPDDSPGGNFWGYMTFGYFAPDRRYSSDKSLGGPTREFKEMVQVFHDAGIEVYLDVVYNHSGEGGSWHGAEDNYAAADILFLKGFDNSEYYSLVQGTPGAYWETTGCGNNLQCDNPVVKNFITDSLTYWLTDMGVDGFRFDLAPVLGRELNGDSWDYSIDSPTLAEIQALGVANNAEMIAEAWDCGGGGFQVGNFPNGWSDWNGRYRDTVRGYLNNGATESGGITYADAFNGDYNNYYDAGNGGPHESVNFVVAHDGFTLADLVSYSSKQNTTLEWPFGPSDGGNDSNISTDSGGDQALRRQRIRNYMTWMMFSRGVPMIVYGDELGRTQNGNNNPYNIDSIATWNNYNMVNTDTPQTAATGGSAIYHNNLGTYGNTDTLNGQFLFTKNVLNLRQNSPALNQDDYGMSISYMKEDGATGLNSSTDRCAWIRIDGSSEGDSDYLVLSNMYTDTVSFTVPPADSGKRWVLIIDTASWAEDHYNFWDVNEASEITDSYGVNAWAMVVLKEVDELVPVNTPEISPASSYFSDSLNVTSSCSTVGAVIRYTSDGNIPTLASDIFPSEGLTLTTTATIKIMAFKAGMEDSSLIQATYTKSASGITENPYGVMLQGFNWASADATGWYNTMTAAANDIKNTFEYVWFPPPSNADSSQGYLPRMLNTLDSSYGTAAELEAAISAISPAKAIADIVINHRVGSDGSWGSFSLPSFGSDFYSITSDDEGFTNPASDMYGSTFKGAADTGEGYGPARDLDHTNTDVQNGIITWMNTVLRDVGFVGWRYDFVKGYSGEYVGYYNEKTDAAFSVGEYWPTAGFDSADSAAWKTPLETWLDTTDDVVNESIGRQSRVFDFVLKGNLNTAFGYRTAVDSSNLALWDLTRLADSNNIFRSRPESAVTFIDNHDTGSTQQHWELDPGDLVPAYAFLLSHPGYPCVAWQHYFTGTGDQYQAGIESSVTDMSVTSSYTLRQHIDRMIEIRQAVKIKYDSPIEVLASDTGYYAAKITGDAAENNEIIIVIGTGWTPAALDGYSGNTPIYSGTNFAVWQKNVTGGGTPPLTTLTFYFRIPSWINQGVDMYTDGNGTSWAGVVMTECTTASWYKCEVTVTDAVNAITYQARMKQDEVVKYMQAVNNLSANAEITAPNGFIVIDASGNDYTWSGDNFCLKDAGLIWLPETDPEY